MSEPEIWYVIRAVANGCAALESHGLLHGDIQPRHILIMPDETIKLFEAPLLNQYFNGYTRVLQEQDYNAALSPQELDALRSDDLYRTLNPGLTVHQPVDNKFSSGIQGLLDDKKLYNDEVRNSNLGGQFQDRRVRYVHTEKDEVFSLGITSLCAACNNPLTDFYDMKTLSLSNERINQKLTFMRELGYSPQLINLIAGMINVNPLQRPTLANILGVVNTPYSVIGNNGQIIGQAVPGPINGQSNFNQGQSRPGQPLPNQQAPIPLPLQQQQPPQQYNPGMAAFQQGVPQRSPVIGNTVGPAQGNFGTSIQGTAQPLNPGMSSFQQGAPFRTSGTTNLGPAQPSTGFSTYPQGTASPGFTSNQRPATGAPIRTY